MVTILNALTGKTVRSAGSLKRCVAASQRLIMITPVVLLLIFLLLYTSFKSTRLALLIFDDAVVEAEFADVPK